MTCRKNPYLYSRSIPEPPPRLYSDCNLYSRPVREEDSSFDSSFPDAWSPRRASCLISSPYLARAEDPVSGDYPLVSGDYPSRVFRDRFADECYPSRDHRSSVDDYYPSRDPRNDADMAAAFRPPIPNPNPFSPTHHSCFPRNDRMPERPFLEERRPSFSPCTECPRGLDRLLRIPLYRRLWDFPDSLYDRALADVRDGQSIHQQLIRSCILYKKHCQLNSARLLFLQMIAHNADMAQYWIEFARMEMESGCYEYTRAIVDTALQLFPDNVFLLSKRLKIADKQGDVQSVTSLLDMLFATDVAKAIRVVCDGATILVRLGEYGSAVLFTRRALQYPVYFTGWFFCELLAFMASTCAVDDQTRMVDEAVSQALKHSPLWSLCLDTHERITLMNCPLDEMDALVADSQYEAICSRAFAVLTSDAFWKLYRSRILRETRLVTAFRSACAALSNARIWRRYQSAIAKEERLLVSDARSCVYVCPPSLRWKVYLTLGRSAAALGQRERARAVCTIVVFEA